VPKTVKWRDINSLPDLVIEEAWVSNDCNPTLDESVYVDVVIKNIGGSSTPFLFYTAIFYNRETAPDPATPEDNWYPTVGCLEPDAIDTFTFVLPNPSYAATWIMWLLVDSDNQTTEGNENNNVFGLIYVYWEAPPVSRRGLINRNQIINNAMKFVNVTWTCPEINRTRPFDCTTGPDWTSDYTIGVEYQGEPYEWGGWDIPGDLTNPKCFLYYVTNNLKRAGSHDENDCQTWGDPSWATGVDCAGLVSRAWDIFYIDPNGYRSKPGVSTLVDSFTIELPDYYSLKRGDALISTCTAKDCGKHTFLFNEWAHPDTMQVIEARSWGTGIYRDRSRVNDSLFWAVTTLIKDEYKPYKYEYVQETQDIIPGDVNSDGKVSVSDVVYLILYLFKGGAEPIPPCKANVNGDNKVSVSDVVWLINYL
jgi:hypothetical protein